MSQFTEGRANQPLLMAGDIKIAPYICYEVVYPDFVRANRATLRYWSPLTTWFGASTGPATPNGPLPRSRTWARSVAQHQ